MRDESASHQSRHKTDHQAVAAEAGMRTTLDIEDDVLLAARELARQWGVSMGKVLSDLARQALTHEAPSTTRGGVPLFPIGPDADVVTLDLVSQLLDGAP